MTPMSNANPLYAKSKYRLYRENGHYFIRDGLFTLSETPHTLAEAKEMMDNLARCTTCGGDKVSMCHVCRGDGRLRNGVACVDCLGRGYVRCLRCGGTGVEPC